MKKVLMSALAIATIATTITSCKKGDDDAGLSLSGRKSRIAGEWTVDKMATEYTNTDKDNGTSPYTETTTGKETFDGGSYSSSWTWSSTQSGSGTASGSQAGSVTAYTMTIEKDGTWKSKKEYKITSKTDVSGGTSTTTAKDVTITEESEGTWQFMGKNKSLEEKNKESVAINTTKTTKKTVAVYTTPAAWTSSSTSTSTWGKNENVMVMHLSMLKKKEMAGDFEMNTTSGGSSTTTAGGTTTTNTNNDYTNKGTGSMSLSQK